MWITLLGLGFALGAFSVPGNPAKLPKDKGPNAPTSAKATGYRVGHASRRVNFTDTTPDQKGEDRFQAMSKLNLTGTTPEQKDTTKGNETLSHETRTQNSTDMKDGQGDKAELDTHDNGTVETLDLIPVDVNTAKNVRKKCYEKCGQKDGHCPEFCGKDGLCCRSGHSGGGCDGKEGDSKHHTCVLATHLISGSQADNGLEEKEGKQCKAKNEECEKENEGSTCCDGLSCTPARKRCTRDAIETKDKSDALKASTCTPVGPFTCQPKLLMKAIRMQ